MNRPNKNGRNTHSYSRVEGIWENSTRGLGLALDNKRRRKEGNPSQTRLLYPLTEGDTPSSRENNPFWLSRGSGQGQGLNRTIKTFTP